LVEQGERIAEGERYASSAEEVRQWAEQADRFDLHSPHYSAWLAAMITTFSDVMIAAAVAGNNAAVAASYREGRKPFPEDVVIQDAERREQAALLREIIGNPFRPPSALSAAVRAWNDGTVVAIARPIYDDRAYDRLPILADALEDAGLSDDTVLSHLRSPGPHVRGCWALDLVLDEGVRRRGARRRSTGG
jgi:hypothetical protein